MQASGFRKTTSARAACGGGELLFEDGVLGLEGERGPEVALGGEVVLPPEVGESQVEVLAPFPGAPWRSSVD